MVGNLTTKEFWDNGYKDFEFSKLSETNSVSLWLRNHLNSCNCCKSLELGNYPGQFMTTLGDLGYELNGVDYNENNYDLKKWLISLGYDCGDFHVDDIFQIKLKDDYDLVCSFGLIEHFYNYEEVIEMHLKLIKKGGKIALTTPNFRGWMQFIPHWLFDRINLRKHYLPSMNPSIWKKILEKNNFEVQYSGYFGGYVFWTDKDVKRSKLNYFSLRFFERAISQFAKVFKFLSFESSAFSAYCGLIATKK